MRAVLIGALAVIGAAAAAIALNVVLLGYAAPRTEPVGRLNPAAVTMQISPKPAPALPHRHGREKADD